MSPATFRRPAAALGALAAAAAATVAVQVAGAGTASACGTPQPSTVPISRDAPYDSPASNQAPAKLPAIRPAAGQDFGHLPRWKHYADGRVLLREDRVTLRDNRRFNESYPYGYTNENPRLRSYWLDPAATITVGGDQHARMTGTYTSAAQTRVSRAQFLDSFHTGGGLDRYLKYRAVYRLTFDASHTTIVRIEEMPQFYTC